MVSVIARSFSFSCLNGVNEYQRLLFVVPLAFFWPVATHADFFGQWNNIFLWQSIAFALAASGTNSLVSFRINEQFSLFYSEEILMTNSY